MHRILIFGFAFLFPLFASAQSWPAFPSTADTARWSVAAAGGVPPNTGISTFIKSFQQDTFFCGKSYSIFQEFEKGYIRSDSARVFLRKTNNCTDKEYLMYDYTLQVGDSGWFACFVCDLTIDTCSIKAIATDDVLINGVLRKRIQTQSTIRLLDSANWIHGIGSDKHPLYSLACNIDGCEVNYYKLLCYDSSQVSLYIDPAWNTCDTTYIGIPNSSKNQNGIKVFPNPSTGELLVNSADPVVSIQIYDLLGNLWYLSEPDSKHTTVSNLHFPSGIYFITLATASSIHTKKLIFLTE